MDGKQCLRGSTRGGNWPLSALSLIRKGGPFEWRIRGSRSRTVPRGARLPFGFPARGLAFAGENTATRENRGDSSRRGPIDNTTYHPSTMSISLESVNTADLEPIGTNSLESSDVVNPPQPNPEDLEKV